MVDPSRYRLLNSNPPSKGPILYWMSRDQRIQDNWALALAQQEALKARVPFLVVFCLVPHFLQSIPRHFQFMIEGLIEIQSTLKELHIPFYLLTGNPETEIISFANTYQIGTLISDMSPLTIGKQWRTHVANNISVPFIEVDAHNTVPVWVTSPKQEFSARTIRPKIHKILHTYLVPPDPIVKQKTSWPFNVPDIEWETIRQKYKKDSSINWIKPGENAAKIHADEFVQTGIKNYNVFRNNPNEQGQSNLSPYLHFGHISAQTILLRMLQTHKLNLEKIFSNATVENNISSFIEEIIIRKELAENFCFYNPDYDSTKGFPQWAKTTLSQHRQDRREHIFSIDQLEQAKTYDPAWNASQIQMIKTGKMHGYMRMYWAKKILEWTPDPETALSFAIQLNDTYSLDGRDPNGYAGIAWSIGGVHDRPWFNRPIFGTIRYMNSNGLRKKFNLDEYIKTWLG